MTDLVLIDHPSPHVARITLNRPERLNAMSIDLVSDLNAALDEVAARNDTWVAILTGAGEAFSSGLDLKDYGIIPNIDGLQVGRIAQRSMRHYSQLIPRMRSIPQPIIAAVNGVAFGGGMCLTLGADIRIASESATFNATGIVNGLASTEMGVSFLLPRLIGAAHSNDVLLTGRRFDAAEAHRIGLVSRVVLDAEIQDAVQPVRSRHDQGDRLGQSGGLQPRGSDRARGSQPAHDGVHEQPPRGHPGLRRRPPASVLR